MSAILSLALLLPPAAYQLLSIIAGLKHLRARHALRAKPRAAPVPVSVLKPLRGLDPNLWEALISQAEQDHPEFELLFGVASMDDPAVTLVRKLQALFPRTAISLITSSSAARNGKVGLLSALVTHARYATLVVNDSDIRVGSDYLREVTAPLQDEAVGIVTCPYRAIAHNWAAGWEALGVAIDFMPSTLVAPLVGVREFGLGSTLAFRRLDLASFGGFEAIADYLADDYQLGKRITQLGKTALLSTYVVETSFADDSWRGVWRHQLRWGRTIRTSKGSGYAGLPLTQAGIWILILLALGSWRAALLLTGLRFASAYVTGGFVLRSPIAWRLGWLAPVWDLFAFAVWISSYGSREVRWRDRVLRIDSTGRIY